jgi:hypothetical protein
MELSFRRDKMREKKRPRSDVGVRERVECRENEAIVIDDNISLDNDIGMKQSLSPPFPMHKVH